MRETCTAFVIMRSNLYYKHDYPVGQWVELKQAQIYANQGAATRQANKLSNSHVVECVLTVGH